MTKIRNRIRLFTRDRSIMDELHSFLNDFRFERIAPLPKAEDGIKEEREYYKEIHTLE